MAALLDGRKVAGDLRGRTAESAYALRGHGVDPTLALVTATDDEATAWYVGSLQKAAAKVGVATRLVDLGPDATEAELAAELAGVAADATVHGVILQTPLPAGVDPGSLAAAIPLEKDVDGANPASAGRVMAGRSAFAPATASAVLELLQAYGVPLTGANAVVIGRSMVVGKPVAHLLLAEHATVTICHSRTRDLPSVARRADVLVAAIGRPRFLGDEYVKPGAVVVDVGTTPDSNGVLVGDVDAGKVDPVAGALSPVPGGVGPVTTALLLRNTVAAATMLSR